ncbi:hypothetical protein FR932_10495 [Moritella marina ATCC 15381]|uniref:Lipoprotein LPP20-like domain-containing protein n=1 Tax=Moritella marina ATCC 15381 TaxID=1202962 RepID=A0A5J6WN23_MORMI|nr:LPP20 family lipoprotein [Moritella marina]QFI38245.1 hypothetical protein FR932_10495 [Moritella marina ATCC 15381]
MKHYLLLIVLTFIYKPAFAAPDWAENPPSQEGYIIGVGLGEDITKAKQGAISSIARTLNSNVTSSVSSRAMTSGTEGAHTTLSTNAISSEDVLLPHITWVEMVTQEGVSYAIGKVSKSEVIALYEDNLNIALKPFGHILSKQKIDLNDYLFLLANKSKLDLSAKRASSVASSSTKASNYHRDIEVLLTKQNAFIGSACFNVKKSNDRMADKIYLPSIESAIQSSQFVLKDDKDCTPVRFRSKTERTGKTVANVVMQIDIGQPALVSKVIKFKGQSSGSYKSAMMDAANNFSNYFIDNTGLLNSLLNESANTIEITL